MTLDQTAQVAAILSVSVPLCALAWSAVAYVRLCRTEIRRERYERFFEVMEHLGKQAGRLLPKWPQPSSSENFPEYADVIIRLIDHVDVEGQAAPMLKAEMALTADFLRKKAKL